MEIEVYIYSFDVIFVKMMEVYYVFEMLGFEICVDVNDYGIEYLWESFERFMNGIFSYNFLGMWLVIYVIERL